VPNCVIHPPAMCQHAVFSPIFVPVPTPVRLIAIGGPGVSRHELPVPAKVRGHSCQYPLFSDSQSLQNAISYFRQHSLLLTCWFYGVGHEISIHLHWLRRVMSLSMDHMALYTRALFSDAERRASKTLDTTAIRLHKWIRGEKTCV
jgi:hypothetical protein